jgi:hypothetical protein
MAKGQVGRFFRIGFDLREPMDGARSDWSAVRRSAFLIRPDVQQPISVDRSVWPSIAEPSAEHPLGLWFRAEGLLQLAEDRLTLAKESVVVELAALTDGESYYWERVFEGLGLDEGGDSSLSFHLLGYDVADRYLVSGVSNCEVSEPERAALRDMWSSSVNKYGLFGVVEDALKFRAVCDDSIREHSPFCVYRIRVVRRTSILELS